MPADSTAKSFSRSLASVAVVLTIVAGFVDAIGYLSLGHVYVANMSGNSIAIGIHGSEGALAQVLHFVWPVLSFTAGVMLSRLVVNWGIEAGWRSIVARAIGLEILALAAFAVFPPGWGVFLAACAMGIQAATLSRFNGVTVYTCFVTGSLVRFGEHGADLIAGYLRPDPLRARHLRSALWFGSIWSAYVAGAILGAIALHHLANRSVPIAVGCLALLASVDLIWPTPLEETVP